jgi:hypothetical protein|nr:hypothetical protein [Kofleriaceae bacterium]
MRAFVLALASLSLATLAGCDLYWNGGGGGGGGGDDQCYNDPPAGGGLSGGGAAAFQLDPDTGACVQMQTYSCPCGEACAVPAQIITGECDGPCANLDENDCLATAGCHAAYVGAWTPAGSTVNTFNACWDIQPAPVQDQSCSGLDAYSCSFADSCVSVLMNGEFTACQDEPGVMDACAGIDCGSGYTCGVSCDAEGTCAPACVANGQVGSCDASSVKCNMAPPSCEAGTTPGVLDACWSGYCIPNDECTSGCSSYTDETDCLSGNCTAIYQGSDCTCYSNGSCSCASETFESCE